MVQRVVEGALPGGGTGIRVSRPGFNVLDPNLTGQQLSFDSRWPRAERVFLAGSVLALEGNGFDFVTIYFGQTLSQPPTVLTMYRPDDDLRWRYEESAGMSENISVFSDRMEIRRPTVLPNRIYSYIVLRP